MSSDYAVCIEVDNSRKIVNGLSRTATVGEVVEKLRVSCGKKTPQLLLESWRGCSRVMASEEKLCISFEQWGSQARDVELIMAEARRYNRKTAVRKSRRGRGCSGKVAWRKSVGLERKKAKIVRCVNKRHSIHLVRQLEEDVTRLKEEIAYHEPIENALSSHDHMSNVSGYLPPELREEYSEVMQNADDQHQVTTELLQHRAELRQKVTTKQNEKMALEKTVDELHKKIQAEQRAMQLMSSKQLESAELISAQRELTELQAHLKSQIKISQLQSEKIHEMALERAKIEKEIGACIQDTT